MDKLLAKLMRQGYWVTFGFADGAYVINVREPETHKLTRIEIDKADLVTLGEEYLTDRLERIT